MRLLELMTTEGCHLCDLAVAVLVAGVDPNAFQIDLVDIAFEDELLDQYGTRIPVLRDSESLQELDWPFDGEALSAFLRQID